MRANYFFLESNGRDFADIIISLLIYKFNLIFYRHYLIVRSGEVYSSHPFKTFNLNLPYTILLYN